MTSPSLRSLRVALLLAALPLTLPHGASAQALGNSFNGLQVQGDQPIAIESDQLDVDDANALATFTGNVSVAQGETLIKTAKLLVYYAKGGGEAGGEAAKPASTGGALPGGSNQIDRIEASGKVYIKSTDQVATAETADFDMKSQIAILKGNVILSQGENVARGETLTIYMDTGIANFGGGRVKLLMAPGQAPSQGAGQGAGAPRSQ
ncbi:MAG: OstA family protein [Rhizobiaceae bacterium]|nr:OstA family protein [Rhizobiaceae bacterium]